MKPYPSIYSMGNHDALTNLHALDFWGVESFCQRSIFKVDSNMLPLHDKDRQTRNFSASHNAHMELICHYLFEMLTPPLYQCHDGRHK